MEMEYTRAINACLSSADDSTVPSEESGTIQVGPNKWILPKIYKDFADEINNFEARPDDVFICAIPRSGTTWTQEMIWLLCNDLDYETALKTSMHYRVPYFELHLYNSTEESLASNFLASTVNDLAKLKEFFRPIYEQLAKAPSPRFIKTHLPIELMPKNIFEVGAKVVYIARNPKDVSVSSFHHVKDMADIDVDFENYARYFMSDFALHGPYWKHVLDGWSHRHDENVLFMFYEDLKKDLEGSLKKLAKFLGKPLKDEELSKLVDHLQFEKVKKNPSVNFGLVFPSADINFVRRGQVGGNPEITEEISATFDKWTEAKLAGSDFPVPK